MSKTLRGIGNATLNVQNKSVNGVRFATTLVAATAGTAITLTNYSLANVKVLVNVSRGGKKHRIIETQLDVIARESSIRNAGWDVAIGNTSIDLRANGVGIIQRTLVPVELNFHSGIVLRGDDTLEIQIQTSGATYGATIDQNNSQIEFSEIQCDCEEYGLPKFDVRAINTGDNVHNVQMADNVKAVTLVNTAAAPLLQTEAAAVISTVNIASPDINASLSYYELLTQRNNDLQVVAGYVANVSNRGQSFVIVEGNDLDDLNVTINLNSANVLAASNFVVVRYLETDPLTVELASVRQREKSAKKAARIGLPGAQAQASKLGSIKNALRKKRK